MTLNANQKRALRRLWPGDLTTEEIRDELGVTPDELAAAVLAMGLPVRQEGTIYIPTPETIRLECAKIRSAWTPAEREARLGRLG